MWYRFIAMSSGLEFMSHSREGRPTGYIDRPTESEDIGGRTERGAYDPPGQQGPPGLQPQRIPSALPVVHASLAPHRRCGVGQARVDGRPEGSWTARLRRVK